MEQQPLSGVDGRWRRPARATLEADRLLLPRRAAFPLRGVRRPTRFNLAVEHQHGVLQSRSPARIRVVGLVEARVEAGDLEGVHQVVAGGAAHRVLRRGRRAQRGAVVVGELVEAARPRDDQVPVLRGQHVEVAEHAHLHVLGGLDAAVPRHGTCRRSGCRRSTARPASSMPKRRHRFTVEDRRVGKPWKWIECGLVKVLLFAEPHVGEGEVELLPFLREQGGRGQLRRR